MSAASLYQLFMWMGAIGAVFALLSFVGAWVTSNVINTQASQQISQLEKQVGVQRSALERKDEEIARLEGDLGDYKKYEWLAPR
jgi:hypothetical protein